MTLPNPPPWQDDPQVRQVTEILWRAVKADENLIASNAATYKTLLSVVMGHTGFGSVPTAKAVYCTGDSFTQGAAGTNVAKLIYFASADYAVSGQTLKLRIRAQALTNATAPAQTTKIGLYPVTSPGGVAGNLSFTIGTVVTSSEATFTTPSASTANTSDSGDFTIPADGYYALGVIGSAGQAANSFIGITAQLMQRSV